MASFVLTDDVINNTSMTLTSLIDSKVDIIKSIKAKINFAKEIIEVAKDLESIINKATTKIEEEEKEIKEMNQIQGKLSKISNIATNKPVADSEVMNFVVCESMITNSMDLKEKESIAYLDQGIEIFLGKLEHQLKNRNLQKNYKKGTMTQYAYNPYNAKNPIKPLSGSKSTKKISSGILLKTSGKNMSVSDIDYDPKNKKDYAKKLANSEKKCEKCQKFTKQALMLGYQCCICISCLKKQVQDNNKNLIDDTFEAQHKQKNSICGCTRHGTSVNPKILIKLFGEEAVEKGSILALKNQQKYTNLLTKSFPNICDGCYKLIKDRRDPRECNPVCQKHRIYTFCYRYL